MNPSKLKNQAVPLPPRRPRLPEQKRSNRATIRPPLIPLEIPHITQGCQGIGSHDTRLMYRVTQVPQVTLFLLRSQIPSLPSLPKEYSIAPQRLMVLKRSFKMTVFSRQIKLDAFGLPNAIYRNLSPVSPLYYDRPFGRPQTRRAKPIPLSFLLKKGQFKCQMKTKQRSFRSA